MNLRAILLFLALFPALLHADDVVFFKNSGQYRMFVWINGAYQGWVNAGTTVYMPREGFVTQDSGFQPDGTLKTTHSHGGWEVGGLLEFKAFSASFDMEGKRVAYYSTGTVPYKKGDKRLGLASGKDATAVLPSDYEMETAGKMQAERPPGDLLALLNIGKEEVPAGGGANPVGSITDGGAFPLWYAGRKKKDEGAKIDLAGLIIGINSGGSSSQNKPVYLVKDGTVFGEETLLHDFMIPRIAGRGKSKYFRATGTWKIEGNKIQINWTQTYRKIWSVEPGSPWEEDSINKLNYTLVGEITIKDNKNYIVGTRSMLAFKNNRTRPESRESINISIDLNDPSKWVGIRK